MSVINIQKMITGTTHFIQEFASGYSFSVLNIPRNINKVASSIFLLFGLANVAANSVEVDTDQDMSNAHCKKLCNLFLEGQSSQVMNNCFLFCNKVYPK